MKRIVERSMRDDGKFVLTDEDGEKFVVPTEPVHRWRWLALAAWIVAFTVVAILMYGANRHRINDIQTSRVASCERTYHSIEEVALSFFPPPKQRNARQKRIASGLRDLTTRKVQRCKLLKNN